MEVQMFGIEQCQQLFLELPKNMEKEINKTNGEFMKIVHVSARARAPKFSGQLAESIIYSKKSKNNWELVVESPYGFFQEYGFTGKFLAGIMPVQGGYRILDWMQAKGIPGAGIKPSGEPKPFIQPALEMGLSNLPSMLADATLKATKRSKK